jgi:hypothetical protein
MRRLRRTAVASEAAAVNSLSSPSKRYWYPQRHDREHVCCSATQNKRREKEKYPVKRKIFVPSDEANKGHRNQEVGEGNETIGCSMQPNQAGCPQTQDVRHEIRVKDLIEKRRHKIYFLGGWGTSSRTFKDKCNSLVRELRPFTLVRSKGRWLAETDFPNAGMGMISLSSSSGLAA